MRLPFQLGLALVASFATDVARAATPAVPPAPLVHDTNAIRLFNGRDLEGWHVFVETPTSPPSAAWTVDSGILRCAGVGRGYVRTTTAYGDYRLRLEWRWPGRPGNSGVMINVVGPDRIWPKSVEAQLANNRAGDFATFSDARSKEELVGRNPSGVSTGRLTRPIAASLEKPPGEWNVYEIVVAGDTITLSVNGTLANRMTGVLPSAGLIAFQAEGTPIDFREIELTPLPPAKDLNAPMPR